MPLNRPSEWNVMTIWISRELPLFIVEHPDISWASNIHPTQKLWLFECAESFRVQFQATLYYVPESDIRVNKYVHLNFSRASVVHCWGSRYIMGLTHTPEWKVMTIWISRELPLFIVESPDISWASHIHPSEKLWPFEFLESFRCSLSSIPIYHGPRTYTRV